jgi:hypothetical protein
MNAEIYFYKNKMSDGANKLIDNIIFSVSPTPKWAYCAGGAIDTKVFPINDLDLTKNKVMVPLSLDYEEFDYYLSGNKDTLMKVEYYECDLRKISRLVQHTIKEEGIYLYDVTFIDSSFLLYSDVQRIPSKNPQIYEMCWYGREIYKIVQRTNTNGNFAENMPQESIKTVEPKPSKTESNNVCGYSYFVDHLSALSIQKDYNKEKNRMVRLNVRENTDHNSIQSVTISDKETLKDIIMRLREMESWMGEDKR